MPTTPRQWALEIFESTATLAAIALALAAIALLSGYVDAGTMGPA